MKVKNWVFCLKRFKPCREAVEMCNQFKTARDAWENWPCEHIRDQLWLVDQIANEKFEMKILQAKLCVAFAESVLHVFEDQFPEDERPRRAIEARKAWIANPCDETEMAWDKARSGAHNVSYDIFKHESTCLFVNAASTAFWFSSWDAEYFATKALGNYKTKRPLHQAMLLEIVPFETIEKAMMIEEVKS